MNNNTAPTIPDDMLAIVLDRCNQMLTDPTIKAIYDQMPTNDQAETWLIKSAVATLMTSPLERYSNKNLQP